MGKRSLLYLVLTIVLLTYLISGCAWYPDGTEYQADAQSEAEVVTDESGNMKGKLTAGVNIDAKIEVPNQNNWKNIQVQSEILSSDSQKAVLSLLGKDENSSYQEQMDQKGVVQATGYHFPDGSSIDFSKRSISYSTPAYIDRGYNIYISDAYGIRSNIRELFPYEELDGVSRTESIQKVQELCRKLNIEISNQPEVYAIDYEHAQSMVDEDSSYNEDKFGNQKVEWSQKDNAYVIYFRICKDGIPLTDNNYRFDSGWANKALVEATVSKDGLIDLQISGIYKISQEVPILEGLYGLEDITKVLESKFYYTIGSNQMQLSKISLEYVPVYTSDPFQYTLKPYWVCTLGVNRTIEKDNTESTITINRVVFIDAVTKKVLN